MLSSDGRTEPFPAIEPNAAQPGESSQPNDASSSTVNRPAASSSLTGRLRRVSQSFGESSIPEGFFAATGGIASSVLSRPTAAGARSGSVSGASSATPQATPGDGPSRNNTLPAAVTEEAADEEAHLTSQTSAKAGCPSNEPATAAPFDNGYHFPPSHTLSQSMALGLRTFWNYLLTPVGFCVTIYGLNVVAWGGMLFLLLCNAAPAMCHPSCNDINSPRRKWIEWDSQILNALFCVTGFGLAPWRFRDLYFLLQYRLQRKQIALRRLAGIHRGWFRLAGSAGLPPEIGPQNVGQYPSQELASAVPYPESQMPSAPLTGRRAPPTKLWKLDVVIWLMVWNTFLQCCLAGFMWALNRHDRPSWSTGLFVALACCVAGIGGLIMFLEGKKVKGIEGVPVSQQDLELLERDRELGVWHYNNIKDKDPVEDDHKKSSYA